MLTLALALAQTPQHMLHRQPNLPRGAGYAFFEAFPVSGAGTTVACSTTAPTGAKGETLTFTRTGNATCSKKGLATTGIADGDLVVLSGNVARVEPDSDGVLGLRVEGTRANVCLRSAEIDNAAWVDDTSGAAAPTRTANYAVSPDGATTAERLQIPAVTAAQVSGVAQLSACPSGSRTASIYAKAVSGTPRLDLSISGTASATSVTLSTSTWTRLVITTNVAAVSNFAIGSYGIYGGAQGAIDVLVWGAQCEAGAYATSYIPTVAAAVTRNAEGAYFTLPTPTVVGSFSHAISVQGLAPSDASTTRIAQLVYTSSTNYIGLFMIAPSWLSDAYLSTQVVATQGLGGAGFSATGTRLVGYNDGNQRGLVNGLQFTSEPAGTRSVTATYVRVGTGFTATQWVDGILSKSCFEPNDSARCR